MTLRTTKAMLLFAALAALALSGCAKYNTFYNAKRAFDEAEHVRRERIKNGEDVTDANAGQVQNYQRCIRKCQYLIEEYPGHSLIDDALFLIGKSAHRIQSYRMSITNLNLLAQNFPAHENQEEAEYLQAMNYMFIGDAAASNDHLERLRVQFPESRYQAEALRVRGDNAFSMERWEAARDSYRDFLEAHPDDENAPEVSLKLGRSLWMLHDYDGAAEHLERASEATTMEEVDLIAARQLQMRCYARQGRHDEADAVADLLEPIVSREGLDTDMLLLEQKGMVAVARAENLYHAGDHDGALAVLNAMDDTWKRGDVGVLAGEMIGEINLARWDLEEALPGFQAAAANAEITSDRDRVKNLTSSLRTYLQTEERLEGAGDDQLSSLKLIMANILLLSFDRPRAALDHYLEIADAAESDSSSAVRGLYGAAVVYRDHLALPDSAEVMLERLSTEYPDSPQAYVVAEGESADLYGYLLARERELAALQAVDVVVVDDAGDEPVRGGPEDSGAFERRLPPGPGGRVHHWRLRRLNHLAAVAGG